MGSRKRLYLYMTYAGLIMTNVMFTNCGRPFSAFEATSLEQASSALNAGEALAFSKGSIPKLSKQSVFVTGSCLNDSASVQLDVMGAAAPQTIACNAGRFSAEVALPGADGLKTVVASQKDAAGNVHQDSVTVTKDTTAPMVGITNIIQQDRMLVISGTCEMGAALSFAGDLTVATSPECQNNLFQVSAQVTAGDGNKRVEVRLTDGAGNLSVVSQQYKYDTTPPILTITSPVANSVIAEVLTLKGTCETGLQVSLSGIGLAGPATGTCAANMFSIDALSSSGDGSKLVTVTAKDEAGNKTELQITYKRETPLPPPGIPVIAITQPAQGTMAANGVTISGTCVTGLNVQFSGAITAVQVPCNNGQFSSSVTFTAGEGAKVVTVTQTNSSGSGTASRSFVRDSVAPKPTIVLPTVSTVAKANVTVAGACETGLMVMIGGTGVSASSNVACTMGSYSGQATLNAGDGTKNIRISQTDGAGNIGQVSVDVTKDSVAPTIALTSPNANTLSISGLTVAGTCETGIPVIAGGTGVASAVQGSCNSGGFSLAIVFSTGYGEKLVTVSQTDGAGNVGTSSRSFISQEMTTPPDGIQLYNNNCMMCHGALSSSVKIGRTAVQITNAITTIPTMNQQQNLKALTSAEINAIATALNITPSGESGPSSLAYSIPLGDRNYLKSVFEEIFMTSATNATNTSIANILKSQIWSRPNVLGGACSRYDDYAECPEVRQAEGLSGYLSNNGFTEASMMPKTDAMRSGFRELVCDQILEIDGAVVNALAKAGLTTTSAASDANLTAVYQLFLVGETPSAQTLSALRAVHAGSGSNATNAWRFVMQPLCTSPGVEAL